MTAPTEQEIRDAIFAAILETRVTDDVPYTIANHMDSYLWQTDALRASERARLDALAEPACRRIEERITAALVEELTAVALAFAANPDAPRPKVEVAA